MFILTLVLVFYLQSSVFLLRLDESIILILHHDQSRAVLFTTVHVLRVTMVSSSWSYFYHSAVSEYQLVSGCMPKIR